MSSSGSGGDCDCSHRYYCVTHLPETPRPATTAIDLIPFTVSMGQESRKGSFQGAVPA